MAASRSRASRRSTPSVASSRSRTPQPANTKSPLPIRPSIVSRRSTRLASVKNSSPADSEMDSEDVDVGDSYLSRGVSQKFKEVRVPLVKSKDSIKIEAPSPSSVSSESLLQRDRQSNYDTPGTSVAVTPADVGKTRRGARTSSAIKIEAALDGTDESIVVQSSKAKGKRKMSVREEVEIDDEALAEALQNAEYSRAEGSISFGSKRQRIIPASDESSDLSVAEHSEEDTEESEYEDDEPLMKKRASRIKKAMGKAASRASKHQTLDTDGEEDDLFKPEESEAVETDVIEIASTSSSDEGEDEPKTAKQRRMARDRKLMKAAVRKGKNPDVTDLFSDEDEKGKPLGKTTHRFWAMNRIERGQYTLAKNHPEIKTLWEDLEKIEIIKPVRRPQPSGLSRQLKPFQQEGFDWMLKQEKSHYKGGLLGDEMGMGKTIQAVALIMSDYPSPPGQPTLVVVPPVALVQWSSEISSYTDGKLNILIHHNMDSKVKKLRVQDLQKYDVILISYSGLESVYRKESKGWSRDGGLVKENSKIHAIHFHRLILDEAHNIKTRTTGVAKACFALQGTYKWCLSGTPVQNRIGEFFSLLRFLEVRPFACYFCKVCPCNELHWQQTEGKVCAKCKHSGFNHVSIFNQELLNPITHSESTADRKAALRKLRMITDRIMLRRMKRDHTSSMELPPKEVVIHNEFFGNVERDFSASIMTNSSRQFDTYVSRGVMLNNYANIFGLIMQMRQVANHPDLILKKHAAQGQNVLVCCVCDEPAEEPIRSRCRHEFCRKCARDYMRSFERESGATPDCPRCHIPLAIDFEQPDIEQEEDVVQKNSIINRIKMEDWTSSTKIEMLVYDLYKLRSKKQTAKSIVFSQFTSMLQLVEWRLRRAGFNTVMLDGTMTPAQRSKSIDYFMNNVDVEVFLVSLKAGGVALNLTEASRVFIVDPWWNPAAEYQSADRCHRIGQRRPCIVKRLVIEDSVESRMVLLQEKKANMIAGTVDNDDVAIEKLTPEDMSFLFRGT